MARTTSKITAEVTVTWCWWLKHYLVGVAIMAWLTGRKPDRERMRYWVDKGIKTKVR